MVMTLLTRPKKTVATVVIATDGSGDFNCDGTADNVEIQAAIDSLPATGGCIYIKEGTYNLNDTITIINPNVSIIGCGNSTIFTTNVAIDIFTIGDGLAIIGHNNIILENFFIDGNAAANRGIYATTWVNYLRIFKLWIYDCNQEGIYASGPVDSFWTIANCHIHSNGGGVFPNINLIDITLCVISGNTIYGGGTAIEITTGGANIFTSNYVSATIYGVYLNGCSNIIVSNNRISSTGLENIYLTDSSYNNIDGNNLENSSRDGIELAGNSDYNTIHGNIIDGSINWGINISVATCNENFVTNNILEDNDDGTIIDSGTNTQIFNNIET